MASPTANQVAWKSSKVPSLSNRIARIVTALLRPAQCLDLVNQAGRRGIVAARLLLALDHRQQRRGKLLAEFHAPLVEGVDAEQLRLDKDAVLVERNHPPQRFGIELAVEKGHRRAVAGEYPVRGDAVDLGGRYPLGQHLAAVLLQRAAAHQRLRL